MLYIPSNFSVFIPTVTYLRSNYINSYRVTQYCDKVK